MARFCHGQTLPEIPLPNFTQTWKVADVGASNIYCVSTLISGQPCQGTVLCSRSTAFSLYPAMKWRGPMPYWPHLFILNS